MAIKTWNKNYFFFSLFTFFCFRFLHSLSGQRLLTFPCFSCTELCHGNWHEKRDECLICMFLEVALCNFTFKKTINPQQVGTHDPRITCFFWLDVAMRHLACYYDFFLIQCIDYSSLQIICLLTGRTAHRFKLNKILWNKQTLKEKQA